MDCLPIDDLCHLQASFEERIADEIPLFKIEFEFKNTTMYKVGDQLVIVIHEEEYESWQ